LLVFLYLVGFIFIQTALAQGAASSAASLHIVRPGESLASIARRYGVQWKEIASLNNLADPNRIRPGIQLRIPAGQPEKQTAPASGSYRVARGDSLWKIARSRGVNIDDLASANGLTRSSVLRIGQLLSIPASPLAVGALHVPSPVETSDDDLSRLLKTTADLRSWSFIVVHHSATRGGNAASMNAFHRYQRGMIHGLAYHFVIGNGAGSKDGTLEIGSRWQNQLHGGHVRGALMNEQGIGICLVGDFESQTPTSSQMTELVKVVRFLQATFHIPRERVFLHREVPGEDSVCPGRYFPAAVFKRQISP
jgi:LysM repeat protein